MEKKWIVMLYLAADNNLSEEGVWTLTEIQDAVQQGNLNDDVGIVVLFDTNVKGRKTEIFEFGVGEASKSTVPETTGYGKRLAAGTDVRTWLGNHDPELNLEDANSPDLLTAFIKKTQEEYHASHHILILSGHGAGAVGDFLGQGEDNVAGSDYRGMSIPTLARAIKDAKVTIDILGMDSCVMSMAEICFELPSQVQMLVGSEGNGPMTGWPYKEILARLKKDEAALEQARNHSDKKNEAWQIANRIQDEYIHYYSNYFVAGTSVDLAVCDLEEEKKDALIEAIQKLSTTLGKAIGNNADVRDQVILAHWRAQSYKSEQYTDLWDFCDLLQEDLEDQEVIDCCDAVKRAVKSIAPQCRYYGVRFQHSNGLSVYFPWKYTEDLDAYVGGAGTGFTGLRFARESNWGDFLKQYVIVTRREMRGLKREKAKFVLEGHSPEKVDVVTLSGRVADVQLLENKLFPPESKLFPPESKLFPPESKLFPPESKLFPPESKLFPPESKGMKAGLVDMKNPPYGFLRVKETGEEIYLVEKES